MNILKRTAESAKIEVARNKILSGEYNLQLRQQKQKEHILGEKQWIKRARNSIAKGEIPPGAFFKDADIQNLISQYAGKGIIEFRGQSIFPREYVNIDRDIGRYFNDELGRFVSTNRIAIHYSSKGTHAYPVQPRKE